MKRLLVILSCLTGVLSYSHVPTQYHIQTDKGPNRYFRYQTYNGQFRKEKRFEDGSVVGSYAWVDANGILRLYDYVADKDGYRVVRARQMQVQVPTAHLTTPKPAISFGAKKPAYSRPSSKKPAAQTRPHYSAYNNPAVQSSSFGSKISSTKPVRVVSSPEPPAGYSMDVPGGRVTLNYDIGNQYRKEKSYPGGTVIGEHGYVDPLGILRRTYYKSGPGGHQEVKKSYWVGTRSPGS